MPVAIEPFGNDGCWRDDGNEDNAYENFPNANISYSYRVGHVKISYRYMVSHVKILNV